MLAEPMTKAAGVRGLGSSLGRGRIRESDGGARRREEHGSRAHGEAPAGRDVEARDGVVEKVDAGRPVQVASGVGGASGNQW
jgi:hypothetical protein